MSKSSSSTAPKIALPTKSAWAKGPPQSAATSPAPSSPRSQSPGLPNVPAQQPTHSRRPSTLGQGVPIKDGVSVPSRTIPSAKQAASPVTFGSIDDTSAPISSSPAVTPAVKSDGVKSFGSVPAAAGATNGKPAPASKPSAATTTAPAKPPKFDIHKMFQNPGSSSPTASSSNTPEASSPGPRPAALPTPNSSSFGSGSYTPFVPGNNNNGGTIRHQQQQQNSGQPPRSPVHPRMHSNGSSGRPSGGPNPGGPSQMPSGLPSPRLPPHGHQQPSGLPQQQQQMPVPGWPGYYYPEQYSMQQQYPGWYVPQQHPGTPHAQPHGLPSGMPISPRNQPPPLQPSTPTSTHAVPNAHTPSHAHSHSITSPPSTPSTINNRLSTHAPSFVPGQRAKVVIKSADGAEVTFTKPAPTPPAASTSAPPFSPASRKSQGIRIESEEAKAKRLADEEEIANEKERIRQHSEDAKAKKVKDEEDRKKKVETEAADKRKAEADEKKSAQDKVTAEAERVRKEKETDELRVKEATAEKERVARAEAEATAAAAAKVVAEAKEADDKAAAEKVKTDAEAEKLKAEEDVVEKARLEKEEQEQEKLRLEQESAKEKADALAVAEIKADLAADKPEEGEVVETPASVKPSVASLRIDTATMPPPADTRKTRPGPLDLSHLGKGGISVPAPLPSALSKATKLKSLDEITYPENIKGPDATLNANAKGTMFRYDRDFLLQFMSICKEKPDSLPPLDAIGIEPVDQAGHGMSRGGSGRRQSQSGGPPTPGGARQPQLGGAGGSGFGSGGGRAPSGSGSGFAMGSFGKPMTSDERFAASARAPAGGTRPGGPMARTMSQTGTPSSLGNNRVRSQRGSKRTDNNKVPNGGGGGGYNNNNSSIMGASLEPIVPLTKDPNAWVKPAVVDADSPELVNRKVNSLLNKLTMEKFDSISDQIIAWANKSEQEKDGRTLIQVIRLVFVKATDEAAWSEMYARLCRKMMEQISGKVQDDGIKNQEGKPIAGGQLFRKYLLNRCQEDFERGWLAQEAASAAAASKAKEDEAAQASAEKAKETAKEGEDEVALYSDEYYAAAKAKRRGLGLIRFIGELFKLQMLTERIMHECVKKLLGNVENPEEEEIESLCKLISTVGNILDTPKARAHMDVYFSRMKELCKSNNVTSRMQFMLQDVIELRERRWVTRTTTAAPTTIAQIHETAAKEKAAAEYQSSQRQMSMSRGGSRRGGNRNESDFQQVGPDGWAVAGSSSGTPRPPPKAGDLSNFGKISKTAPMTFGPSSVFNKKDSKRESLSRASSSSNMFSMLQNAEAAEAAAAASSKPRASSSRKASVDLGSPASTEAPMQRKRLILAPRTKPSEDDTATAPPSEAGDSDGEPETAAAGELEMSEEDAMKKIKEDSKEFFSVRSLSEADNYFVTLPPIHHFRLVNKLVTTAIESKEVDVQLVAEFLARVAEKELCTPAALQQGLIPTAEIIDDIAIDAPKAFDYLASMVKAAALDSESRTRIADASTDAPRLLALLN